MIVRGALASILWCLVSSTTWAATYYADNLNACTGNYNAATRACDGSDGNSYTTFAAAVAPLAPGDTLFIRQFSGGAGVWNDRINLQDAGKSGTAGNYISIIGYPGDTVTIRYTDTGSYGAIKARGARGYFLFKNLIIDGVNYSAVNKSLFAIRDGNHHFILRNIEIKNTKVSALYIEADDVEVTDSYLHDSVSATCEDGTRSYGTYIRGGNRITYQRNTASQNPGGAIQAYPGPMSQVVISDNHLFNNGSCPGTDHGGLVLGATSVGGNISNVSVYNNVIHDNGQGGYGGAGTGGNTGGTGHGIRVFNSHPTATMTNIKINNNTIYNNIGGSTKVAYGIALQGGANNVEVKNNIVLANENGQINDQGTGNTITHNLCLAGDSCGTTGKVSVAGITSVVVSTSDFRLKQGVNPARDAGTAVSTRPSPVGVTDIGAYEQGAITSASVVAGFIELVASVMTPGILPATGITGVTIACVTCTGTPVAALTTVKSGANTTIQVNVSGITGNGTCTISTGTTNATDSLFNGGPVGTAQGLNSVSGLSVSGTCQNTTGGGGGGGGGLYSYFPLNEGAGTTATDASGLAHHGTVSPGVTWVTGAGGTGVSIPTDATFRHVEAPYGSAIDPSAQGFGACIRGKLASLAAQKVLLSAGGNGTGQRWYGGIVLVGGQPQWGIGIQSSGFSTGSEFVATTNTTFLCMVNDAVADTTTLWVDGVKGTQTGKSVKSLTSFTLVNNLRAGNDGTFTTNNGGFTLYEMWTWNAKPADSDITSLYATFTPTGTTPCLAMTHRQFENPFLTNADAVVVATPKADGSLDVVANGTFGIKIQYTCTGTAGAAASTRLTYSLDGTNFFLPVPQILGTDGVAMSGFLNDARANVGVSSGCIDATGLTPNSGVTIFDATAGPTFTLAQNHCRTDRYLVSVGNIPGQSRWFRVQTDAGNTFANGYSQTIKINVVANKAAGGP